MLLINLGIYSFKNPDKPAWYTTDSDGNPSLYRTQAQADLSIQSNQSAIVNGEVLDGVIDIHSRFIFWFQWGFCVIMAPIISLVVILIVSYINETLSYLCSGVLACATGCSGLAWWITGQIWRFRSDGAYACGDHPTGKDKGLDAQEWQDLV